MEKERILKTKIVNNAMRLIHEDGFDSVTMERIAKECEITKRTLYRYFPVKEALLSEYVQMTFSQKKENRMKALLQTQSMEEKVRLYMHDLMQGVMKESEIFEKFIMYVMKNLVSFHAGSGKSSGITDLIEYIIQSGYEEGKIDPSLPYGVIADLFVFSFVEMTKIYYRNPDDFDEEKTLNMCADIFLRGVQRKAV